MKHVEQLGYSCQCENCKERNKRIARRIREIMAEKMGPGITYPPKMAVPMAFKDLGVKVSQQTIDMIINAFEKEQEKIFEMQGLVKKADVISDREYDDMYEKQKVH